MASCGWVRGGVRAVTDIIGEGGSSAIEDVPQVAEVDAVVIHAKDGLRDRFSVDHAASAALD